MQQMLRNGAQSATRRTDRAIVEFAQERLVFAQAGLADVANDAKVRRRIEEQYKRSAREWLVNLAQMPLTIKLHSYREAIERFYEEHQVRTATPAAKSLPEVPVLPRAGEAAIAPKTAEAVPIPRKPLTTALGYNESKPIAADNKAPPAGGGQGAGAVEGSRRKADAVTVRANEVALDVKLATTRYGGSTSAILECNTRYGGGEGEERGAVGRERGFRRQPRRARGVPLGRLAGDGDGFRSPGWPHHG